MSIAAASSPGNLSIARTRVLFSRLTSSTVVGSQVGVSLPKARSRNADRTTCTVGLEMAATTRTAIKPAAKRHSILRRPGFFIFYIYPDQAGPNIQDSREGGLERETGFEPATLSLGMRTGSSAASRTGWQTSEDRTIGDPNPDARSPGLAGFCTREAPIEPQSIARHVRSAEATQPGGQRPLRRPQLVSGAVAWLTVSDVAKQLRVSSATVYRLIDSGELRHGRVSNAIRISQADLAAFLRGDS